MVRHEIRMNGDRRWYDITKVAECTDPQALGYDQYVENTRTEDKMRFGGRRMPFSVEFTDRGNCQHRITIESRSERHTTIIPSAGDIEWWTQGGAVRDCTRLCAQAQVALCTFGFAVGGWNSEGIRVVVRGYKNSKMGEYAVDTKRWQDTLEICKKGTKCVKNLAEAYGKVVEANAKAMTASAKLMAAA